LLSEEYISSHTAIHHLYHLLYYARKTNFNIKNVKTVVEWGGGYGSLARLFKRINPEPFTYIIIDTPIFSTLQLLFLSTIFGVECINLIKKGTDRVVEGKINLVPLTCLAGVDIPKADLFIST